MFLASILGPIFLQNRSKRGGGELDTTILFIIFASCRLFGVPPGSDFLDFRPNLKGFFDHFWQFSETVFQHFYYTCSHKLALFFAMNLAAGCWLAGGWWGVAKRKESPTVLVVKTYLMSHVCYRSLCYCSTASTELFELFEFA